MCMSFEYMFLMMVNTISSDPKCLINVYRDPLIKEMHNFWHVGVLTRDNVKNEIFAMRVTLIWIVNNLPACGMASAWSTAGVMRNNKVFTKNRVERKAACPRLMAEQIRDSDEEFSLVVEVSLSLPDGYGRQSECTKEPEDHCNRPELKVDEARCVDMKELRLHNMNNYDCHIFMQKLIRITFRDMLLESVWSALTEVIFLFQILYSTMLDVNKVQELKASVAIILCNHEKIFPPSFFDSMELLIVHLPYEACMGRPVQYMWMYPFEQPGRNDSLAMNDIRIHNLFSTTLGELVVPQRIYGLVDQKATLSTRIDMYVNRPFLNELY
ncbi:hypothetical protein Sango_0008700 [Sesamum angolense]|uniref:DUF4218 domain-containing protein n=1 Tax=Sesamum angolense TaxID=2727404 RepID=A0AAE1XCE4_9LAMI|nr:hypothetical protein Sango_0008700 [Sesamum angolense]